MRLPSADTYIFDVPYEIKMGCSDAYSGANQMVAIVSGNSLGLNLTSKGVLGDQGSTAIRRPGKVASRSTSTRDRQPGHAAVAG